MKKHPLIFRVKKYPQSGFTLIELLVVMVIIGLLAALVVPKFFGHVDKAMQQDLMPQNRPETEKLWELMATYQPLDAEGLLRAVADHLEFSQSKIRYTATHFDLYQSLALSIRDRMVEFWNDTQQTYRERGAKQVYYLSLEYLVGRSLRNNLVNLGIYEVCQDAMAQIGYDLEELEELEHDAGLGNGGLGRLAACFLDSMATLQLPAQGYGIRYEYGIFEQRFRNGEQLETPDNWLEQGYPWEIPRHELTCPVQFYGTVEPHPESPNGFRKRWIDTEPALAVAYDVPIAGYQNRTVNNLRLWQARASRDFDFHAFNRGDYLAAVAEQQQAGYPDLAGQRLLDLHDHVAIKELSLTFSAIYVPLL